MIGHCLGSAGGLEAIAVIKAITTGWLHPTINQFVSLYCQSMLNVLRQVLAISFVDVIVDGAEAQFMNLGQLPLLCCFCISLGSPAC